MSTEMSPKTYASPIRLAVLLSGSGSNFEAIANAIEAGVITDATIAWVAANTNKAAGIEKAQKRGLNTLVFANETELMAALAEKCVDVVLLAGYAKILSAAFVTAYAGRMLNIHPSLLPRHGGKGMVGIKVHQAVLAAGDTVSGCTVHLVTPDVDAGPILGQKSLAVLPDDTPDTLAKRVLELEHQLYPRVIQAFTQSLLLKTPLQTECLPV